MSDFNESVRASVESQYWSDAAALRSLSLGGKIKFTRYARKVLPLDGFVFWLSADVQEFEGALFRDVILSQDEDQTIAITTITFTTINPIQEFEQQSPDTLWIGEFDGIKFAFSRLSNFFDAAGIWYYTGIALQAPVATQLIDSRQGIDGRSLIVSNSLPLWLQLVSYGPIWLQTKNPKVVLYPSYAVPQNLRPPYGSVHIEPSMTLALQAAPVLTRTASHFRLASDTVNVTLYGLDNDEVLNFIDLVNQFSIDSPHHFGIMNMPLPVDDKRTQPEMGVLAMKKTIAYEVSYNQASIREIARKMIDRAIVDFPQHKTGE